MCPAIEAIQRALESIDARRIHDTWEQHTKPYRVASQRFVALALDVLDTTSPRTSATAGGSSSRSSISEPLHSGSGSDSRQLYASRTSVRPPTVTGPCPTLTPPQAS